MKRSNKINGNKDNENLINENKSNYIQLSEAPLLYQRSTELIYRLDHLRFHSHYDFNKKIVSSNSNSTDLKMAVIEEVKTKLNDDFGKINHTAPEIKTDLEDKKNEEINEKKDSQDLKFSYKMYLQGLHWNPSSSLHLI